MASLLSRFVLRAFACFFHLFAWVVHEERSGGVVAAPFAGTFIININLKTRHSSGCTGGI